MFRYLVWQLKNEGQQLFRSNAEAIEKARSSWKKCYSPIRQMPRSHPTLSRTCLVFVAADVEVLLFPTEKLCWGE